MYAVINRYNPSANNHECAGYVYSLHIHRDKAESACLRLQTLQRITGSDNKIAIARVFNGRSKGQQVFPTDIVVLTTISVVNSDE